ncbi:permease [Janthinobacterium fluminis]|uniref:Permease n=1 Tax=Janthinobacterium fluminis TaxID=2987524 RepID=A0ABT5JWC0_9BURK|nr:permease [Janthinobacterium fluminis]MDC8757044.1 permease [Janthinobacterium fluminis]
MRRRLALERSTPLWLSLRFFVTAPLFMLLAGAVLLWQGPQLFASRWSPGALAATHLVTLGVLTMVIAGALLQLLPVVGGVEVAFPALTAPAVHLSLCAGTLLLAGGFCLAQPLLFQLALPALLLALLWLLTACGAGLWRAPPGVVDALLSGVRVALLSLFVTLLLGAAMASAFAWPLALPLQRLADLHALWGLSGWIGVLVVAIAYQVIPMFQVTPLYPAGLTRALCRAMLLLMLAASAAGLAGHAGATWLHGLLLAGFTLFALVTLRLLAKRKRPAPDATTLFWRTSMGSLLACAALWYAPLDENVRAILLGLLFMLGFAYSAVVGMLYKIVPFLLWQHWQEMNFGKPVPSIRLIVTENAARAQFASHLAALLMLAAAALWPQQLARAAALALLASTLGLAWILWRALHLGPPD